MMKIRDNSDGPNNEINTGGDAGDDDKIVKCYDEIRKLFALYRPHKTTDKKSAHFFVGTDGTRLVAPHVRVA